VADSSGSRTLVLGPTPVRILGVMNQGVAAGEVNITFHFDLNTLNAMAGVRDGRQSTGRDFLSTIFTTSSVRHNPRYIKRKAISGSNQPRDTVEGGGKAEGISAGG